jgi:hypothetical protein
MSGTDEQRKRAPAEVPFFLGYGYSDFIGGS